MAPLRLFGFTAKGISQQVLAEETQLYRNPSHSFLSAVYRGLGPVNGSLMAVMNPAEILGVAAGFTCSASNKQTAMFDGKMSPAALYSEMMTEGRRIINPMNPYHGEVLYEREVEHIDNISHVRNVRQYISPLSERLNGVSLPDRIRDELASRSAVFLKEFDHIHDPCGQIRATRNTVKICVRQIFDVLKAKYEGYLAERKIQRAAELDDINLGPGLPLPL